MGTGVMLIGQRLDRSRRCKRDEGEPTEMTIKKLLAALGAVFVVVLGAAAHQHSAEPASTAVSLADGSTTGDTPWTK
jgi:hypothetical protein